MPRKIYLTEPLSLLLEADIRRYINHFPKSSLLSPDVLTNMAHSYACFIEKATNKFIKGQIEHGGDLRDRNLNQELSLELQDLFWYGPFGAANWSDKKHED